MTEIKKFLTIKDFAAATNYTDRSIRQMCLEGKIKAHRIGNARKWMIDASELEIFGRSQVPQAEEPHAKQESVLPDNTQAVLASKIHDKEIFEKSSEIIDDTDFEKLFECLGHNYFFDSQLNSLGRFLGFFESEGNKYADWHINYACLALCNSLQNLLVPTQENSIMRFLVARCYEKCCQHASNEIFCAVMEKVLNGAPNPDYANSPLDEMYLVLDDSTHQQVSVPELGDIFRHESYLEFQREFDKLLHRALSAFRAYRACIRDTLLI